MSLTLFRVKAGVGVSLNYNSVLFASNLTETFKRVTVDGMTVQTEGRVPEDTLANRLVLVRRECGLSQREAAIRTGVSFGEWQGLESGRGVRRVDEKVRRIADALGYDRNWIMWGGPLGSPHPPNGGTQLPRLDSNQKPIGYRPPPLTFVPPPRLASVTGLVPDFVAA